MINTIYSPEFLSAYFHSVNYMDKTYIRCYYSTLRKIIDKIEQELPSIRISLDSTSLDQFKEIDPKYISIAPKSVQVRPQVISDKFSKYYYQGSPWVKTLNQIVDGGKI